MVLAPGSRLAQYEIVSAVGSGGMGVVYRARDTRLNREVALKVMAPHIASDPAMRTRFETEARAVASLTHPGILSIYELAVAEGVPFAVMELLEENGLQDKVRVVRMGIPDRLITHGDAKLLLAKYGLDADGIYNRVRESIEVLDERRAKRTGVLS